MSAISATSTLAVVLLVQLVVRVIRAYRICKRRHLAASAPRPARLTSQRHFLRFFLFPPFFGANTFDL